MVTSQEMREFALECLRWSDKTEDPSNRDIMVQLAKTWMSAANQIDCHILDGRTVEPDLRRKLD